MNEHYSPVFDIYYVTGRTFRPHGGFPDTHVERRTGYNRACGYSFVRPSAVTRNLKLTAEQMPDDELVVFATDRITNENLGIYSADEWITAQERTWREFLKAQAQIRYKHSELMNLADLQHHIAAANAEPDLGVRAGTMHLLFSAIMQEFDRLPKAERNGVPLALPDELAKWREKQALILSAVNAVERLWETTFPGEPLTYIFRCKPQSWE